MIPYPRSPKLTLAGIGLHDPLHGRQACPEFNSFYQGVGQICPREGLFSCRPLQERGQICDIPAPPPIVERLKHKHIFAFKYTPNSSIRGRPECIFITTICVSVMAYVTKRSDFVSTLRSSSVTFSKRSVISSGGRAARVMEFCAVDSNPLCPFFPPFSPPHSPLQYHR